MSKHPDHPTDDDIVTALTARSEQGLADLAHKYGHLCHRISLNLLGNNQDAEECVNDVWLAVWNHIPPDRPTSLTAYLARITRNISIDRIRLNTAQKRNGSVHLLLDELAECIPDTAADHIPDQVVLDDALHRFLRGLSPSDRTLMVRRYFHGDSTSTIAAVLGLRGSTVRVRLHRLRRELKKFLATNGIYV